MRVHHHRNLPGVFAGRGSRIYDRTARTLLRGLYARIADDLVDVLPDGADVLDVGTGPGVLLTELARRRPDLHLVGVDLSADMVSAAQRNLSEFGGRATAQQGDVVDLPFAAGAFDLVVSSFSSHHWDDPAAAVPELARVLRPGGRLYVYDFGFAPFDVITETARSRGVFGSSPVRTSRIRTGVLCPRRCTRQVLTA
ncbi:class I SAM-dependent methyltransferase [Mycolicibacterium pallens]|uniref:Class I SAM-dependent methyltransferase n=1 Tax=Mycolicibacterium pallens TaxID=370524 RepID=A0ABX8VHL9_9MYCO|nr:class I SAM-dependent methyltransferase [Mycolicibacterium pallens]QYL17309.1 class I SAM-dependent methyltransferase [Mycolicibacterium pallens]